MACITISDLRPAGSDLFFDTETYMTDLVDSELEDVYGGIAWTTVIVAAKASSVACAELAGLAVGAVISYVTTR